MLTASMSLSQVGMRSVEFDSGADFDRETVAARGRTTVLPVRSLNVQAKGGKSISS